MEVRRLAMWDAHRPARAGGGKETAMNAEKKDRGMLRVDEAECKGCGLCIEACPPKVIRMSERLNHYGYRTAQYAGAGCTGCGICFMACPEPGALTVYRASAPARTAAARPVPPEGARA
jgi:2-oxoglutarate ferredoxin oxidoreductase subunit delta